MQDTPAAASLATRVRRLLAASYMLMFGLMLVLLNGQDLLAARFPHSPWRRVLTWADLLFLLWMLLLWWPFPSVTHAEPRLSREDKLTLLVAIGVGLVAWLVWLPLALNLGGIRFALFFLGVGWIRRRNYYAAAAGWFLAGLAVPRFFAWPGPHQQYSLFLVLGGIGTALQGSWELVRSRPRRAS